MPSIMAMNCRLEMPLFKKAMYNSNNFTWRQLFLKLWFRLFKAKCEKIDYCHS